MEETTTIEEVKELTPEELLTQKRAKQKEDFITEYVELCKKFNYQMVPFITIEGTNMKCQVTPNDFYPPK